MYIFFVEQLSETRAKVLSIHARDLLPPGRAEQGIEVNTILEPTYLPRKNPVHYINPVTLEQWYEQVDRPPNEEEKLEDVTSQLDLLKILLQFIVPKWDRKAVEYEEKDICRLNSGIYQCILGHISSNELRPLNTPTHWIRILTFN